MKIQVGNMIYDSLEEPIVVQFTDDEKKLIAHMVPEARYFCSGPSNIGIEKMTKLIGSIMETETENKIESFPRIAIIREGQVDEPKLNLLEKVKKFLLEIIFAIN